MFSPRRISIKLSVSNKEDQRAPASGQRLAFEPWTNHFFFLIVSLAVLGLHVYTQAFSSWGEPGLLFIAVRGFLIAVGSSWGRLPWRPTRGSLTSPSYLVRNPTLGPPLENSPEIPPAIFLIFYVLQPFKSSWYHLCVFPTGVKGILNT